MRTPAIHPLRRLLNEVGTVDACGVEERAARHAGRAVKGAAKAAGLRMAVSMVDLTTLEGADTAEKVASLCAKALRPHDAAQVPPAAAVCVYPSMVRHARRHLPPERGVRIASVATAFPAGQTPLRSRLAEVRAALADGADEIDMVLNRGAFLAGETNRVSDEVAAVRETCGDAVLKVILETGELETYDNIRAASFLVMRQLRPGDFIKTSTGKTARNATLPVQQVMLEAIRDHWLGGAAAIGMKPAGGIRSAKQALQFLVAVKETLGDGWLRPDRYRFGASALLNDLVRQLIKQTTGAYPGSADIPEASGAY